MSLDGKILLVDDDERVTEFCSTFLSSAGYSVECAPNGFAALKSIEDSDYDLVILDINMPQINGVEFCIRALKLKPGLKDKILFTTGGDTSELDALSSLLKIGKRLILKPFSAYELLDKVKSFIKKQPL